MTLWGSRQLKIRDFAAIRVCMNRLLLLLTLFPVAALGDGRDEDICKHTAKISKLKCERLKLGRRVCENRSSIDFHRCMVGAHSVALGVVEGVEELGTASLEPQTSKGRARIARSDLRVSSQSSSVQRADLGASRQPSSVPRADILNRAELLNGLRGKSFPRKVFEAVANVAKVAVLP